MAKNKVNVMCCGMHTFFFCFFLRNNVKVWNEQEFGMLFSCRQKNLGQSAGGLELTLSNSQFLGEDLDSVSLLFCFLSSSSSIFSSFFLLRSLLNLSVGKQCVMCMYIRVRGEKSQAAKL